MLIDFFYKIRAYQVPVTIREFLDLLRAMKAEVIYGSIEDFYSLARITLIKEEKHFDKFDRAFADYFKGIESLDEIMGEVPDEWLKKLAEKIRFMFLFASFYVPEYCCSLDWISTSSRAAGCLSLDY